MWCGARGGARFVQFQRWGVPPINPEEKPRAWVRDSDTGEVCAVCARELYTPEAVTAVLTALRWIGELHKPARRYWATVRNDAAARVLYDCGHKHADPYEAAACALEKGPAAFVVRWVREGIEHFCDAQISCLLYSRACELREQAEQGEEAARVQLAAAEELGNTWNDQRIETVSPDGVICFRDGTKLGGPTDGEMVH